MSDNSDSDNVNDFVSNQKDSFSSDGSFKADDKKESSSTLDNLFSLFSDFLGINDENVIDYKQLKHNAKKYYFLVAVISFIIICVLYSFYYKYTRYSYHVVSSDCTVIQDHEVSIIEIGVDDNSNYNNDNSYNIFRNDSKLSEQLEKEQNKISITKEEFDNYIQEELRRTLKKAESDPKVINKQISVTPETRDAHNSIMGIFDNYINCNFNNDNEEKEEENDSLSCLSDAETNTFIDNNNQNDNMYVSLSVGCRDNINGISLEL